MGNSLLQRHITLHIKTLIKQGFPPNSQVEITYLTGQFHVFYTFFLPPSCTLVPHEHYTLPKYRRPETSDTCKLTIPCPYHVVIPDLTRLSKTFPQLSIPCAQDIIQLSHWVVTLQPSRLAFASLGSLTLVMPQPLGFTLHLTHSATFTSVITLCQWAGVTQHTPVHHPKNPILGFFWMAKPRSLFTGVRIFSTYSRFPQRSVLPTSYPPTFLSYLPFPIYLPSTYLPFLSP